MSFFQTKNHTFQERYILWKRNSQFNWFIRFIAFLSTEKIAQKSSYEIIEIMRNVFSELNAENEKLQTYDGFLNNILHYSPFFQNSDETFKTAETFSFFNFFFHHRFSFSESLNKKKQNNNIHCRWQKKNSKFRRTKKNVRIFQHYHKIRIQKFCIIQQNIKNQ